MLGRGTSEERDVLWRRKEGSEIEEERELFAEKKNDVEKED